MSLFSKFEAKRLFRYTEIKQTLYRQVLSAQKQYFETIERQPCTD